VSTKYESDELTKQVRRSPARLLAHESDELTNQVAHAGSTRATRPHGHTAGPRLLAVAGMTFAALSLALNVGGHLATYVAA
jgi:hypothetical protein